MKLWRCKLCGWLNPEDGRKCVSCDKSKPRERKKAKPREENAIPCVILALDTANKTGWAIYLSGLLVASGEHPLYSDAGIKATEDVIANAMKLSEQHSLPFVIVSERPWGGKMGAGETKAFGYWLHALRCKGVPMRRIIQVYPSQWRAIVLPKGAASAERKEVRAIEAQHAREIAKRENIGADEAAAILIGQWARHAGEVLSVC